MTKSLLKYILKLDNHSLVRTQAYSCVSTDIDLPGFSIFSAAFLFVK